MRDGEAGNEGDAEPGRDESLDRDGVVGGEPDLGRETGAPAGVAGDPVPGAGRRSADPRFAAEVGELERATPATEAVPGGEDGPEDVVEERDPVEFACGDVGERLVIVDQREVQLPASSRGMSCNSSVFVLFTAALSPRAAHRPGLW